MVDYEQLQSKWKNHPGIPGGFHLEYVGKYIQASIVTGPRDSGLMACNDPGRPTTFEVWFAGMDDPTGYLSFDEMVGAIKILEQQAQESKRYKDY